MDVTTKSMLAAIHGTQRIYALILVICIILLGSACSPSGPKALLQGEQLINKGDYAGAAKKLEIASQKLPQYPQVWNFLGLAYHGLGKNQEAIASYQKALGLNRSFAVAYYNMGAIYFEMNRLPEALSSLTSFTVLQPNSEQAWVKIGAIQVRLQKPDEAERAIAQALRINANNPESYNTLGLVALQRRKPKEALQLFDKALYIQEDYAPAILNQAVILGGSSTTKQIALQRYRAYLSLEPDSKEAPGVRQTIALLEAQLNPPPVVRTNPVPALVVNRSSPVPTNSVTAALSPQASTQSVARATVPPETMTVPPTAVQRPTIPTQLAATNKAVGLNPANPVPAKTATSQPVSQLAIAATNVAVVQPNNNQPNKGKAEVGPVAPVKPSVSAQTQPQANEVEPSIIPAQPEAPTVALETVAVEPDPTLQPVRDLLNENATNSSAVATASTNRDIFISRIGNRERENKQGVFERINPGNWFRGNSSKPNQSPVAAVPNYSTPERNNPVITLSAGTRPAPPAEIKPAPPVPRYPFKKQLHLPEGDRAAAEASYNQAVTAHQEKRLATAIELYTAAVKINPAYFQAYYNLGLAAYQLKDLPLAMSAGEAAVFLRPASLDARYNFALALRDANYFVDATNQLKELLADSPDDIRAHFTLANIYAQQMNQPSLASKHYLKVLELDPRHLQASQIRYWLSRGY